jgi:hypothetical protein
VAALLNTGEEFVCYSMVGSGCSTKHRGRVCVL